jgi:STE24 endopeptidase
MAEVVFWIIILFLVFNYFLERLLAFLNMQRMSATPPTEVRDVYNQEKYKISQAYQKENAKFSFISGAFSFVLILIALFAEAFGWLDGFLRNHFESPVVIAVLFFGVLALVSDIISLPFDVYSTFVIEEKYGFNKTTARTFILDKLKGYLLGALIGGSLLAAITWIYLKTGSYFWMIAWALVSFVTILGGMFYTSLILPLFNKLTPLEDGPLRTAIESYAREVDFKVDNIMLMDGSKRSSKANAFFSGLGPKKKIVLFDTLVEKHSIEELVAVLAHEVGHYKKKHTYQSILFSVLQTGIMFFILSFFLESPQLASALGAELPSFHIGLLAFSLLYSPIALVFGVIMNIISRRNEFEADSFASNTFKPEPLISALKKLSGDNLSNLTPHPAYVFFHYSHPPLAQRISNLMKN